jgi:hypothetical protein
MANFPTYILKKRFLDGPESLKSLCLNLEQGEIFENSYELGNF